MFFRPKVRETVNEKLICLTNETKVTLTNFNNLFVLDRINKITKNEINIKNQIRCKEIYFEIGIPIDVKNKIISINNNIDVNKSESYVISANGEIINIWGSDLNGVIYGLSTLEQLICRNELTSLIIYDYPACSFRGYHVFVPGRNEIDQFKNIIEDILVYYKYNYLVMEIGGALEYKKHPLINERWEEYCKDMREYSGKSRIIQHKTYPWCKNCTHTDNGGGSYLTQNELKEIVSFCNERGIKIIPEVPSLSHSDYLLRAYPELRERELDNHPDTYCPSNPRVYEILFDLIDEIIEVFKPEMISIAHDEVRTIGVCEKCRKKDPVELFASDVIKIYDYLTSKSIKTLMYCDKLLNIVDENGKCRLEMFGIGYAGAAYKELNDIDYIPAIYPAIEKLPKDIIMIHWLWSTKHGGIEYEENLISHGYKIMHGNLRGSIIEKWKDRMSIGTLGGMVPNWGSFAFEYMQRNRQILDLIFTSYIFWDPEYDDSMREIIFDKTVDEFFHYYKKNYLLPFKNDAQNYIKITHTTDYFIEYKKFYDGDYIDDKTYHLGNYCVLYSDGTKEELMVKYGFNISNCNLIKNPSDFAYGEAIGTTRPIECDGKIYYEWYVKNPKPDKSIIGIKFYKNKDKNFKIYIKQIEVIQEI